MTFWEYLGTHCQQLLVGVYQHTSAVFPCMVVATVLGVLIGVPGRTAPGCPADPGGRNLEVE